MRPSALDVFTIVGAGWAKQSSNSTGAIATCRGPSYARIFERWLQII